MITVMFDQVDSWCFREARPMGAVGGQAIKSVFPPPPATLIGAVRTLIGDALNIDWKAFAQGKLPEMSALIGNADNTGALRFSAPYLMLAGERLYPAPAHLMASEQGKRILALQLGDGPVRCDLGQVFLPDLLGPVIEVAGAKPLSGSWLTQTGWQALCKGQCPNRDDVVKAGDIWVSETRLGIAKNDKGTVEDGMLYQTEHVRLKLREEVTVALDLDGMPNDLVQTLTASSQCIRLGGEGRMAQVRAVVQQGQGASVKLSGSDALLLLPFGGDFNDWCLPGFSVYVRASGEQVWRGSIDGIELDIECFSAGKAQALGGWDSAKRQPKPVVNLVPAGSVYFIKCAQLNDLQNTLEQVRLGSQTDFGFGQAVILPRTV